MSIRTRDHSPIFSLVVVLISVVFVPVPGQTQDSSAPSAQSTEAPKSEVGPSTPAPAEPSPPAAPESGAVRVPEVVVSAPRPKRAASKAAPRETTVARRVIAPRPATSIPIVPPQGTAATQGEAASDAGPGALAKPPGQTITTLSGERIKDEPAFTIQDLLQQSPGVSFK
jgi:hypothetical protein